MSAINYLTLASTIVVTSSGTPVPPGYINIASTNSAPTWSNNISTNGIQGSTILVSSITTSTITVSTLSVSTMTGSTLTISMLTGLIISASSMTSSDLVLSTLTVSSINGLPPGTGSGGGSGTTIFSTLGVSSLNANSTITGSTLIATGRVGIGSTTMNGLLSVNAGATNTLALSLTSSGPGWGSGMQLINNTATTGRNYGIYAGSDGALHFPDSTAGADRVLINYLGNVGIGTNTPGYLLDVNGTLNVRGSFTVNGTAVATGTGSVWTVGASNCIYYSAGNTCLYRNRLVFSNAINDFNHSIFNNSSNWDGEGAIDGFKYNGYACHWFRVGNASGAVPTTAMFMNNSAQVSIGSTDTQSNMLRIFGGNATSGISLGDYMTSAGVKYIGITAVSNGTSLGPSSGFSGITFGSPYDGGGTSGYLAFHTHGYGISSDERMRIDKSGRVGIGKNNPSQLLDVAGAINCTSFLVNGTAVATGTGSVWGVSGSTAYYTSGNVGISTTAAITNLHVRVPTYSSPVLIVDAGGQGTDITPPRGIGKPLIGVGAYSWSNVSSGDYYGIGFGYNGNNAAATYYAAEIGFLTQTTSGGEYGDLVFSTRPTTNGSTIASERMRITSGGLIGIGTTNPNTYLCVGPNGGVNQTTQIPGISMTSVSGQNMHYSVGQGTAGTNNVFLKWGYNATASSGFGSVSCYGGNNPLVLQEGGGNVGIGTLSPAYKLVVQTATSSYGVVHTDGTISLTTWVGTSGAGGTGGWLGTISNHDIQFFTNNGGSRMTINTSGQVGIGTITPGSKLHIHSTTANDGILFQNAFNSSTGSIALYTSTAAGNYILDGTADAGIILPTAGKDLYLNRTTSLYTSVVVKGGTGSVGIGTATPIASLQITNSSAVGSGYGALLVDSPNSGSAGGCVTIRNSAGGANAFCSLMFEIDGTTSCQTGTTPLGFAAGNAMIYCQNVGAGNNAGKLGFILWNGGAEVETMTILPSGNVGIGTATPATSLHIARAVSATADYSLMTYYENTVPAYHDWAVGPYIDGGAAFAIRSGSNNLPANLVNLFFIDGYGTAIRFPGYTTTGTLSINGSGGVISSSSDRRIKRDIVYQTDTADALARVLQLRPATFRFLEKDATHLGFIAQDVEQCIPLAVDGKKYEWQWVPTENGAPTFDAEGNMIYQLDKDGNRIVRPRGLEDRAILAMQTLAIQQLAAENTQLKSQVASLSASHASLLAWAQTQGFVQ